MRLVRLERSSFPLSTLHTIQLNRTDLSHLVLPLARRRRRRESLFHTGVWSLGEQHRDDRRPLFLASLVLDLRPIDFDRANELEWSDVRLRLRHPRPFVCRAWPLADALLCRSSKWNTRWQWRRFGVECDRVERQGQSKELWQRPTESISKERRSPNPTDWNWTTVEKEQN